MASLAEDPARYYQQDDGSAVRQGDIVLTACATFVRTDADPEFVDAACPSDEATRFDLEPDDSLPVTGFLEVCPAMVTTHDCGLNKEFNKAVTRLRKEGMTKAQAEDAASGDGSLDRLVTVSPIVPLDELPSDHAALASNTVVGYFPVCELDEVLEQCVVNLSRSTTVDRSVLSPRLGMLTNDARAMLRYALARYWVYRAPEIAFEIEDVLNEKIVDVQVGGDDGTVDIILSNGAAIRFAQSIALEPDPSERTAS